MSVLLTPVIYESAVNETYSKQSCNGKVRLVEFSPNNNTVLILLTNKVLQYYDV